MKQRTRRKKASFHLSLLSEGHDYGRAGDLSFDLIYGGTRRVDCFFTSSLLSLCFANHQSGSETINHC